jgi:uncharacterized protein (TIGR02453 family)
MPAVFTGFPKEGIAFLKGLEKNNNREWFQARKETFDAAVKAPMEELVEAINARLVKFAPQHVTEPRKAVYRIYRDTRFSKDKTPYKTHIAANFFRAGFEKHAHPGYYFSVSPKQIEIAAGCYMPDPDQTRQVREYLLEHHEEFRRILAGKALVKLLGSLSGEPMTRTPKAMPCNHPADDLIRYRSWVLYDTRIDPALITTPKIVEELVKRFQLMSPFVEFLSRPLSVKRPRDPMFT